MLVKRSRLAGMLLRPLGHVYWGVEQTDDGFTILGKGGRPLAFSELAESPKKAKILGFQAVSYPLKGGADIKLVGLKDGEVARLIVSAQRALYSYCGAIIDECEDDLRSLVKAISFGVPARPLL